MSACTFFGHRSCYGLEREVLYNAIESLIGQDVDTFYVGNQGQFDGMVHGCLKKLSKLYPHIRYSVVLAYFPAGNRALEDFSDTMYPEIEGPPRFAIDRRNKWMIDASDYCLCYIDHTWGGAYKFAMLAKKRGKILVNLADDKVTL